MAGWLLALLLGPMAQAADTDAQKAGPPQRVDSASQPRTFKTFLPKPGVLADEPPRQVVQLLLDYQDKGGYESYMIQVLFRGKPAVEHVQRAYSDRIEIDFYDTGKPAMRLARIRGGALEANSLDELYYRDAKAVKRMVRLTLFIQDKPDLRFRNTLDRTLIHFRLAKPDGELPKPSPKVHAPVDSVR